MSKDKNSLTGIKPTGEPHIGNYLGAMRPALTLVDRFNARYFIADYHALNGVKDQNRLRHYSYSIGASWLACGLDPTKVIFYRQSDISEIFELVIILNSFTSKGLMNRAHAYKAAVDFNRNEGQKDDHQINMGLFTYPILMAADILLFDTDIVPVGSDQKQHIEIAQEIAKAINFNYHQKIFTVPEPLINNEDQIITGLDGRKMSKSYDNVIPLFCDSKRLKQLIGSIVTNSQGIDEVKNPLTCNIFSLYKKFATKEESDDLAKRYKIGGLGWGQAKSELFDVLELHLKPLREKYAYYIDKPEKISGYLEDGALKARVIAKKKISQLRQIIGIDA